MRAPGAGLGLALVEALVVQVGGELRLCHHGTHTTHGRPVPVPCEHGDEMSVSVIVPVRPDETATPGDL